MAFGKFCRTPCTDESEPSPIFLTTFDAVVTDNIDSFKSIKREF